MVLSPEVQSKKLEINPHHNMYRIETLLATLGDEFGSKFLDVNKTDQMNLVYRTLKYRNNKNHMKMKELMLNLFLNTPSLSQNHHEISNFQLKRTLIELVKYCNTIIKEEENKDMVYTRLWWAFNFLYNIKGVAEYKKDCNALAFETLIAVLE